MSHFINSELQLLEKIKIQMFREKIVKTKIIIY